MGIYLIGRRLNPDELAAALASDDAIEDLVFGSPADPGTRLDLDKAWDGLHLMLKASADRTHPGAEVQAVLGGTPVGDDLGYGPARLLDAESVMTVAAALGPLTEDAFAARIAFPFSDGRPQPMIWDEADFAAYIRPHYAALRDFYLDAATRGSAVLLALV